MAFPAHLLKKVDDLARQNYESRSSYIRGILAREVNGNVKQQDNLDKFLQGILEATKDLEDE